MPYFFFDKYYILIVIPALLLALIAQGLVKSTYAKYSKVASRRGLTASQVCRMILDANNLGHIQIAIISGELTDNYNPRSNIISLSDGVANSTSVAALGIAAHEAGHAMQYADEYLPIRIRSAIIPVTQFGSSIAPLLILAGIIFSYSPLITFGIFGFALMALFQLVTLPVEFNASSRAMETLGSMSILDTDELAATKKVLNAAAMTYVAALLVAIANVLRLMLLFNRRDR